jgi:hypothetical protein
VKEIHETDVPRDDQVSTSASRGRDATVPARRATHGCFGELVNSVVLLGSMTIWDATEESDLDRALVIQAALKFQLPDVAHEH